MLISIIRYIKGYVRIKAIGYSPERFLNACSHRDIYLWGLKPGPGYYEMSVGVPGFRKLKPIIKKTGTKVVIAERVGLPFFFHKYRKRKVFFVGAFLCVFLVYMMSLFIWNIDITGNISRTDEALMDFLKTTDVTHGMRKSKVNCPRIVKDIRKQYNDIIWVSASTKGTRLIIQIKENEDSAILKDSPAVAAKKEIDGTDIVADYDCVITDMVTRQGTPMVQVGDTVKKGDILVSGRVEVLNDSQEIINYHYQISEATIRGRTSIPYEDSVPLTYEEKQYYPAGQGRNTEEFFRKKAYFLRVGRYLFTLGSYSGTYSESELAARETQLCLGKDFVLPISFGIKTCTPYDIREQTYSQQRLRQLLTGRFETTYDVLEKKGVEILENNVKIYTERNLATAKGSFSVVTDVGAVSPTEVAEIPSKDAVLKDNAE